ncbi:unnamed protein product [Rhizophagus irregularis]|nr:unnamed protein product [Rhizophagus irregularis]
MIYYLILRTLSSPSLSSFPFPFVLPFPFHSPLPFYLFLTPFFRLFFFEVPYPVPSALDFLVGFLGVGRHLASVFFFVGWYLAVDQHLGMNRSWWSQNRTLKTCRRNISDMRKLTDVDRKMSKDFKDAGLNTNQTLRTHRSTDFKSASLDYKEGNSFLRGLESALGLEYVICFLGPDQSLQFFSQLLSFYSVHLTCNTIRGSWIDVDFDGYFLGTLDVWDEYHS